MGETYYEVVWACDEDAEYQVMRRGCVGPLDSSSSSIFFFFFKKRRKGFLGARGS